jgi:hypothetical protein
MPSESPEIEVEEAVELFEEEDTKRALITHFKDKTTSICVSIPNKVECYSKPDENKELFYIAQAWLTGINSKFRVRKIE